MGAVYATADRRDPTVETLPDCRDDLPGIAA